MSVELNTGWDIETLLKNYQAVRQFSENLAEPLSAEDCGLQSMTDASPTKWHLAHTTWFFETFVLGNQSGYKAFDESFAYLFNSYYNTVGKQFPRKDRGQLSRPTLAEILKYRAHVDRHIEELLSSMVDQPERLKQIIEIGLNHEQQHQELILTDIKHALSLNPAQPVYRHGRFIESQPKRASKWLDYAEDIYWIGHYGGDFCFDNELPRHRQFLEPFQLRDQLVTCGEYLEFMEDGGYERPELWLSLGWQAVCEHGWKAPLYWHQHENLWHEFTLAGPREIVPESPLCHVSYLEADAYARWAGARLPTEAEWEIAATDLPVQGNLIDSIWEQDLAVHPHGALQSETDPSCMYGDAWEWTASPYTAYPGYEPAEGALGEYNGKFMCNQYVLRGGSCATASTHIRPTYRNFFPAETRWQFAGIRLCQ